MGDGTIVEFGSVVDAVASAVALQKAIAARQQEVAPERRIVSASGSIWATWWSKARTCSAMG
jgi:adenylate cyclase